MFDIATFASMSKELQKWAIGRVYVEGAQQTYVKYVGLNSKFICSGIIIPTEKLLSVNKFVTVIKTLMKPPVLVSEIAHIHYTIYNGNLCLMLLYYDKDDNKKWTYELFDPPSYIKPHIEWVYSDDLKTHVKGVNVFASQC